MLIPSKVLRHSACGWWWRETALRVHRQQVLQPCHESSAIGTRQVSFDVGRCRTGLFLSDEAADQLQFLLQIPRAATPGVEQFSVAQLCQFVEYRLHLSIDSRERGLGGVPFADRLRDQVVSAASCSWFADGPSAYGK